ncbi:membrane protein involved in aromatic hydrocarbon degradation [Anaeromyxobacter dehalogenans 2CP-1]|uniref:Membrane protein involved in aromatic hydrocarbon degradation n=1 Tax=Anaeromyxobacter dehalogenans (strain ATCC BAA-258 / DSM 21875 / 2CP-1) TaxID=455488 RepID=B8J9G8_ANAD2|nr:outer membrane protein transport protein [Anaeromyxobacter dehalogenans]ACL67356.1 membrane protein involved in aromatic hydrocarbon degradation [Anaeromyxobacter dehalogenans 2CP-1]
MTGKRWIVAAALALWASQAGAVNGMRMIGFGPVQSAMGGASVGLPLDSATVITNPAGLSLVDGRVDFGITILDADVRYRAVGAASGQEQTSSRRPTLIPGFGLVVPLGDRLTFGLGGYGIAGLGVDYPQDLLGGRLYTSYSQLRLAPGVSYRVTPELSLGVTANIMYATLEYSAGGGLGLQPRDGAISYGGGFTVGATWRPVGWLTAGVAYESRGWFQDFEYEVPAHTIVVDPATGATANVGPGVEKLELDQPDLLTFGVGLRPVTGLAVAADVQWIRWSQTNGRNQPRLQTDPALTGGMQLDLDWSDQWVLKVGAEYAAASWLKLRAGYDYGKSPLNADRALENLAFPAVLEHHVTAGVGLELGRTSVSVGGTYAPEGKQAGSNLAQGIAAYETTFTAWTLDVGVAHRF